MRALSNGPEHGRSLTACPASACACRQALAGKALLLVFSCPVLLLGFLNPSVCPSVQQIPEHLPRGMHCWPWGFWGGQDGCVAHSPGLTGHWRACCCTAEQADSLSELWPGEHRVIANRKREVSSQAWGRGGICRIKWRGLGTQRKGRVG